MNVEGWAKSEGVWAKNGGVWAKSEKVGKECNFVGKGVISLGKEILFIGFSPLVAPPTTTHTCPSSAPVDTKTTITSF